MNVKQVYLNKLIKGNIIRVLRKQKYEVWQKLIFNLNWKSTASPQRAAMMETESERLQLEYDRLERQIKTVEQTW